MLLLDERKKIIQHSIKMLEKGLTNETGGNISIINRDLNLFAISPSGRDYYSLTPEDIVILDMDGEIVDGELKPSSESEMHRLIYKNFKEAGAVVHCHSPYATALSILNEDLPASNYLVAVGGGKDIKCTEYRSFGTKDIALEAIKALKNRTACLLANHGQITYSTTIESAFSIASTVEECAMTYMIARSAGVPKILSDDEMDFMVKKFKTYRK